MLDAQTIWFSAADSVQAAPFRSIVSLAGRAAEFLSETGVTPPAPGRVARHGGVMYLWAGPETWLAMADDADLEDRLRAQAGPEVAITDQSDGKFVLFVHGPRARKILAKLVPIDLDEEAFDEDATALTLAGHIPVQIWREEEKFALACFRSFAEGLHHALLQADTGRI